MDMSLLILGFSFLLGMITSAAMHIYFGKTTYIDDNFLSSTAAVWFSALICIPLPIYFLFNDSDMVAAINYWQYITPLLSAGLIFLASLSCSIFLTSLATLIACALSVFVTDITIIFVPHWPLFLNSFFTIIALWLFALSFYCISGLNPFPQSQVILPSLGFVGLSAFGAAPLVTGISTAALSGILFISYVRGNIQPINHAATPLFGFIVGWLGLLSYPEYLFPCFIIFVMYHLTEAAAAGLRKLTTLDDYATIPYNSTLYRTFEASASSPLVIRTIWHIGALLILLGFFQLNSPNTFSFPIFALLICLWQHHRLLHWQKPDTTFKEDLQESISSARKALSALASSGKKNSGDK